MACAALVVFASASGLPRAASAAPGSTPRFATGPDSRDPLEIALDHFARSRPAGRARAVPEEYRLADHYLSTTSGTTHVILRQQRAGIDVWNADFAVHVARDGSIIAAHDAFADAAALASLGVAPAIDAREAVAHAARQLDLPDPGPLAVLETAAGPARSTTLSGGAVSLDDIPAELVWVDLEGGVRLAWNLVIREPSRRHAWSANVDAETGEILALSDWIAHDAYRVFGFPLRDGDSGPRALAFDPADPVASPLGWHDVDNVPGADFTTTQGNNVVAQEDLDANDAGGTQPDGGPALDFDFPYDPTASPVTQVAASVTNLFYWTNFLHDVHYRYGFTEGAGNFQQHNRGLGGISGDPLYADALDPEDFNNASMLTPPDGQAPVMQMGVWSNLIPRVSITSPPEISGVYPAGEASFGPIATNLTGSVAAALDPVDAAGPSATDGCSALANPTEVSGRIALVDRGTCLFTEKVINAQNAGAIAVIVANNVGDSVLTMGGDEPPFVAIPAFLVTQSDGARIRASLPGGVTASLSHNVPVLRDSAFSNGTIIHEYGHGVSNRLTGGPGNASCLDAAQSAGMGEGWSDFWDIALTARASDDRTAPKPIAAFSVASAPEGPGIRTFDYSTDMAVDPLTFANIGALDHPHGVGEVWALGLYETFWELVDAHGFDEDVISGAGGNNLALQLVMDGLELQPCNPSFIQGRDALILADLNLTGGQNRCAIWRGFAKRGMGLGAAGNASSLAVIESFDFPVECVPEPSTLALWLAALTSLTVLRRGREAPPRSGAAPR